MIVSKIQFGIRISVFLKRNKYDKFESHYTAVEDTEEPKSYKTNINFDEKQKSLRNFRRVIFISMKNSLYFKLKTPGAGGII